MAATLPISPRGSFLWGLLIKFDLATCVCFHCMGKYLQVVFWLLVYGCLLYFIHVVTLYEYLMSYGDVKTESANTSSQKEATISLISEFRIQDVFLAMSRLTQLVHY